MLADEFLVLDQLVAQRLLHVTGPRLKLWQAVDRVTDQVKRSISFNTAMSNGVVMVPSSL